MSWAIDEKWVKKAMTECLIARCSREWMHHLSASKLHCHQLDVPYMLAYKPTIFSWILTIKLWGSAYMQIIAQQPELARHGPLVGTCRLPQWQDHKQTAAAAVSAYQCGGLHCGGWTHRQTSACVRGASACGAVIGVCAGCAGCDSAQIQGTRSSPIAATGLYAGH